MAFGGTDTFDILRLHAADTLARSPTLPVTLASFGLSESQVSRTRSFELAGRQINGARMDMNRIDTMVALGSTEVWQVRNKNPFPHNFHVHDVQFEVLSIDGAPRPRPNCRGRRDTVYLEPFREYRLIMVFQDYPDPVSPYMYHCHLLLHEDQGMMGQFPHREARGRSFGDATRIQRVSCGQELLPRRHSIRETCDAAGSDFSSLRMETCF